MLEIIEDTIIDSIKLLPFLFITYLIMEYIEHKMGKKSKRAIKKAGKYGPIVGGVLGAFPQCGFSVSATNLYAGRVITLGTLIAVYLSTSDEMLPILISEAVSPIIILKILGIKIIIGIISGIIIDFVLSKFFAKKQEDKDEDIGHICEEEHCHCNEKGIIKSSIRHTLSIFIFILIITFLINIIVYIIGEENIENWILNKPVLGPVISSFIGLIPNCAASVIITNMYLENVISFGSMISGLLTGAGVGLAVLFKTNDRLKENLGILIILYIIGVISGVIIDIM